MVGDRPNHPPAQKIGLRDAVSNTFAALQDSALHLDPRGAATWLLAAGAVVYLGVEGGGYDTTIWGSAGLIACWAALLAAAVGIDRVRRPTRTGWLMIGSLAGLAVWSGVGSIWSMSPERTLAAIARDATYLGVLGLAVGGLRAAHARHLISGIATGIAVIAVIALLSRTLPGTFSHNATDTLLPGSRSRLSYPLNYWNALAELIALGIPLVWAMATSARTLIRRALTVALLPLLVLTLALTFSRGGVLALALASLTYLALAPNRISQLITALLGGAGGALLIVIALHDHALREGLTTPLARQQGHSLLVLTVIVCAAVGALQFAVDLARERGVFRGLAAGPSAIRGLRPHPRVTLPALLVVVVLVFIAVGGPHRISRAWTQFKTPAVTQNLSPARLGSLSGNGRYQFWRASISAMEQHPFHGLGAGTWEFWWTQHGDVAAGYAQNAHSLLFETLAETGIPGGVLIVLFLAAALAGGIGRVRRTAASQRTWFAAATASGVAFTVAALTDWVWQMPVVPICFLALTGLALGDDRLRPLGVKSRLAVAVPTVASLVAIAIPLETTIAIRQSQAAASHGSMQAALRDARTAAQIEPYAATPWIQEALVLEREGDLSGADRAAHRAQANEPENWHVPLIVARIEAERGRVAPALRAARRAALLNRTLPQVLG